MQLNETPEHLTPAPIIQISCQIKSPTPNAQDCRPLKRVLRPVGHLPPPLKRVDACPCACLPRMQKRADARPLTPHLTARRDGAAHFTCWGGWAVGARPARCLHVLAKSPRQPPTWRTPPGPHSNLHFANASWSRGRTVENARIRVSRFGALPDTGPVQCAERSGSARQSVFFGWCLHGERPPGTAGYLEGEVVPDDHYFCWCGGERVEPV
jgi:hypothetical protein